MKGLTPLIIRLADFYGLQIEDAEDDSFWAGGEWKKSGRARWTIVDSPARYPQFYWHSNETEDEFLEKLLFYFKDLDK